MNRLSFIKPANMNHPGTGSNWLQVSGLVLAALAAGVFTGQYFLFLFLLAAAMLGWHLRQLKRLKDHLRSGKPLPNRNGSGPWQEVYGQIRNLQTGNRKRKRRLSRFVKRFREAVTALPDAVVILGREKDIEWCNPATSSLLALHWPECADKRITTLFKDPVLIEYLQTGQYSKPLRLISPAEKSRVLSIRLTPFGKKKRQYLLMARDITRIYHLDQARRDFVANVSHELRTPLTVISGFLETLSDAEEDCPDLALSRGLMQQQAQRMTDIISDLLVLSRLEMDERTDMKDPVPVPGLLVTIIKEADALTRSSGHVIELDADEKLWLLGNSHELHSAFSNLIFNAIQHTPNRSEVRISWKADGSGARFCVSDTGEGIAARHIPRLTERFYRVDKGRSRSSGGTGLGLAIVKHIINHHDAELKIESEPGRGSTFCCHFPAARTSPPVAIPQEPVARE